MGFNLGTGKGVSVREFTSACKRVIESSGNFSVTIRERPKSRPGDAAEVYADPSKAKQYLNWEAKYKDVEEGLTMSWRWRRAHPSGYTEPVPPVLMAMSRRRR